MKIYTTSALYKTKIKEASRNFIAKIIVGSDKVITNEEIVSIDIEETLQPSDGFQIGGTTSKTLDLTILNTDSYVYTNQQIKVEIGLNLGSTIEYIPLGIFNIDDVEKTDHKIIFTCYDNMIKFEKPYFSYLGETATLTQIVNEICNKVGVQFTGTLPNYTLNKLEGYTCREVLSYIASICGGNAIIDRTGKLKIVTLVDAIYSITADNYFDLKREDSKYKISKIACQVGETILEKGTLGTGRELQFENPWVTTTILNDIYNKLNGLEYLGYNIKWQGDLSLDLGDLVTTTDIKGVVRKVPILHQKFNFSGGLTSEISAKGETENKNSFSSTGSNTNKINRVVTELAIVNEALVNKATIQDLTATNAQIENLKVNKADISRLEANEAKINSLEVNKANIIELNAINANLINLVATKANISDLTATNIRFETGQGGTLTLQTLLSQFITGSSAQLLNLTADNTVLANAMIKDAMIDTVSASKMKTGTLDTNLVNILSTSGNLAIKDNTIQIKDSTRVRVQIGKDTTNDYNMYVWDATGKLMFDATGIKADGIKSKIIRDDMVSDTANISGSKLNISSVITQINNDNTTTLKSSKVNLDNENQTLDVAFNSLKTNVDSKESRNLVKNGNFKSGFENWIKNSGNSEIIEENGEKILKLHNDNTGSNRGISQILDLEVAPGEKFTISLLCKKSILEGNFQYYIWFMNQNKELISGINKVINTTEEFTLFISNFTIPQNNNIKYIRFFAFCQEQKTSSIYIKQIKIEKGINSDPKYSEAPEDIESKIQANTTSISVAQGQILTLISENTVNKGNITTLNTNYTSINQTVNSIQNTVSSHTTSISGLNTNVSSMQSSITQLNNKIALKVESSDIVTAISGIEVGGRNLVRNTSMEQNWASWIVARGSSSLTTEGSKLTSLQTSTQSAIISNLTIVPKIGERYTLSIRVRGNYPTLELYMLSTTGDNQRVYHNTTASSTINVTTFTTIKVSFTFTNTNTNLTNRLFIGGVSTVVGQWIEVEKNSVKLERGDKSTDWTPAPEDVDSAISNVDTKISTTNTKVSSLEVGLSGITTRVANTETSISGLNTNISSMQSSITQLNNKIALKVESSDVSTAINNIKIGGRNILKNSGFKNGLTDWNSYGLTGVYSIISDSSAKSGKAITFVSNSGGVYQRTLGAYPIGTVLVVSGYFKSSTVNARLNINFEGSGVVSKTFTSTTANTYTYFEYSIIVSTTWDSLTFYGTAGVTYTLKDLQLEKGNKATDYTESPEYIEDSIISADTKISTTNTKVASIETNLTSITGRVASVETVATNASNNVSSLTTRVSNAEQKITSSAIISTVQSTINSAKTEAINSSNSSTDTKLSSYTTKASMELTSNQLKLDFSSRGGYNLIKNSTGAKGNTDHWGTATYTNPGGSVSNLTFSPARTEWTNYEQGLQFRATVVNGTARIEQTIPTTIGKTYTLSGLIAGHRSDKRIIIRREDGSWGWVTSEAYEYHIGGGGNINDWRKINITFVAQTTTTSIVIEMGNSSDGYIWLRNLTLNEGAMPLPWTPHPEEIYSGNTKIDNAGITITNGSLNVVNTNGVTTIDGSKLMFRVLTYGNGAITLYGGERSKQINLSHMLGFSPVFKGQFRFSNSSGFIETYENNMQLLNWDTGTVNIQGRMWTDDNNIFISIWRSAGAASSGQQTFYYRYFIEEGVNL